jgi:hypothetical protein
MYRREKEREREILRKIYTEKIYREKKERGRRK